jgi:hypothetical protein
MKRTNRTQRKANLDAWVGDGILLGLLLSALVVYGAWMWGVL